MRATVEVVAESVGGVTRLRTLRGAPPMSVRQTAPGTVHLVGSAGGPLGGDHVELTVTVRPGARLRIESVAATVALPGREGSGPSRFVLRAEVHEGATLELLPEPTVAARRCDHVIIARIALASDAALVLREELVTGRTGEHPGGRLTSGLRVERAGVPVIDQEMALGRGADGPGPDAFGADGPATMAGARAVGTLLTVVPVDGATHAGGAHQMLGPLAALVALEPPGCWLATALGTPTSYGRRSTWRAGACRWSSSLPSAACSLRQRKVSVIMYAFPCHRRKPAHDRGCCIKGGLHRASASLGSLRAGLFAVVGAAVNRP